LPVTKDGAQRASRRRSILLAICLALAVLVTVGPVSTSAAWAPWSSVETYYLNLLNCTRTGGWVDRYGHCLRYGSGYYSKYVAPLRLSGNLTDLVTRPYSKLLAVRAECTHYLNGTNPGSRLSAAGYDVSTWGENIGCRDGYTSAYRAVLTSHLVFQAERSTNGGHWQNIKNSRFRYVAVGVWVYSGRTRLTTDFFAW
jgi:hypothetical protein